MKFKKNLKNAILAIILIPIASCKILRQTPPDTNPEQLPTENDAAKKNEEKFICKTINAVFIKIPAGKFIMGNNNSFKDEAPEHPVIISKDFWAAESETTQEQYLIITGKKPSFNPSNPKLPVEQVSWNDAVNFCNILTQKEINNIPKGYVYRLPTEAEWEYMCKSGQIQMDKLDDYAWHSGNSNNDTHITKQKKADKNGLYDTIGNVWEWCLDSCELNEDGVSSETYKEKSLTDPISRKGNFKIHRGGSWCYDKAQCTPTRRYADEADFTSGDLGFRIVLAPKID
ncbi:MAG TPA: formylglycine-generating enzyme family protein [Victivallales bacterium]|mgnify:CR=1 FL=1|nr:formylglycine-generating enzyme family protein [Victivallales bacterium]HPO90946.1 formylglycine-generating enzyme family protein [Victivallales bacterium]HRR06426.1 formylglycine-generating enzyme family protein [Victivallales bacterium]HRR28203.1 formylglycine-generating enzyme family protein [Victivallales bacterium]HRU00467.1 formylglycine-generating enzyme family protein [Victivallales bacterium]